MEMRKTGNLPVAILSVLCLTAALGCAGKTRYYVPEVDGVAPTQAAVGTNVVISGAYFKNIYQVSFGGQIATWIQVNNENQIVATVPPTAISGQIVVMNPAGVGTLYTSFYVTPAITGVEEISDPGVTPIILKLTGSGFYSTESVTVGSETAGQPGSSTFTYNDPNTVTVTVGANATTTPGQPVPVVLTTSGPTAGLSASMDFTFPAT
jgi:hypothetical protein